MIRHRQHPGVSIYLSPKTQLNRAPALSHFLTERTALCAWLIKERFVPHAFFVSKQVSSYNTRRVTISPQGFQRKIYNWLLQQPLYITAEVGQQTLTYPIPLNKMHLPAPTPKWIFFGLSTCPFGVGQRRYPPSYFVLAAYSYFKYVRVRTSTGYL